MAAGYVTLHGPDVYWVNTAGGNWSNPANWSTAALPGPSDNVFIISNGTYTVGLDVAATVSNFALGASSGQQSFSINAPAFTLTGAGLVDSTGFLKLSGGSLQGDGSWTITGQMLWSTRGHLGGGALSMSAAACRLIHRLDRESSSMAKR
jgi:hypothetical protein